MNLLATSWGRLTAFFLLYVTEGLPLGFAAGAIAVYMKREGVSVQEMGLFLAALYAPWGFKWAFGPIVDLLGVKSLGHRRGWILFAQAAMMVGLIGSSFIDYSAQLKLFTWVMVAVNGVCALQDVAIDALAVSSLREEERGLGNGLMFAGAYIGQALGGSGMLYLASATGSLDVAFYAVAAMVGVVWGTTLLFMREPPEQDSAMLDDVRLFPVVRAIGDYVWDMLTVILAPPGEELGDEDVAVMPISERDGAPSIVAAVLLAPFRFAGGVLTRRIRPRLYFWRQPALAGALFAYLPASAMALGLALQAALAVEIGLSDDQIANLGLIGAVAAATGSVAGGWISDRTGHRRTLALYVALTLIPTALLAWNMQTFGWIDPVPEGAEPRAADPGLVQVFWYATIAYGFFSGLTYGTRMAIFMKVCEPKLAATQFTAYMALSNLAISYSASWQGVVVDTWGYPTTLAIDCLAGLACLGMLPFVTPRPAEGDADEPPDATGLAPRGAGPMDPTNPYESTDAKVREG